jgi:hypothetical protein
MAANLNQIPRAQKRDIAQKVVANLVDRATKGPAEPALDAYTVELGDIAGALDTQVTGNVLADAKRTARLARLDAADDQVDTCYRHVESYVSVEARRRTGPNVALALALHGTAFPDGLEHVDDAIDDENRLCRESLSVLRSTEHAPTVEAIELPLAWLDKWEAALEESDAAFDAVEKARTAKKTAVDLGRDAETDWVEAMVRLRRYVGSRAKRSDTARVAEGKELLAPLLDTLAQLRSEAASRATRRENAKADPPAAAAAPGTAAPGTAAPGTSAAQPPPGGPAAPPGI